VDTVEFLLEQAKDSVSPKHHLESVGGQRFLGNHVPLFQLQRFVTSFTVILRPLDYGTATRGNQSLTEMSTRNLPGDKGRPASKADTLTTICEPIV
jgi:hypothetical protein